MMRIWHIGLAVPDLDTGLRELSELFEVTWRPVVTRSIPITTSEGDRMDVDVHVTFSRGGPFAVEVWQAIPGTPLDVPESNWFHHIGYWVDDYPAERPRLARLGYPPVLTSEPSLQLSRGPGGLGIEPCDLRRDQPYLLDLYPADSAFAGEPVLPS